MSTTDKRMGCVMGALVADAAALGLHWIYDPARIATVADTHGSAAFVPITKEHFDGVPAYFAHEQRQNGQLSQYGECLLLAIDNISANQGSLNVATYQTAFVEAFGLGGSYCGYIDRPTRGCLENILAEQLAPSGVEDDQHPALTRLAPLVAVTQDLDASQASLRAAIEITNLGEDAVDYGLAFARLLHRVLNGDSINSALTQTAAEISRTDIRENLEAALTTNETDSVVFGETTERACHLKQGMPLSFHILHHAQSYREAIELNIRAGGDSCGRAMIIGAVYGASIGAEALPTGWVLQMADSFSLWQRCESLASQ